LELDDSTRTALDAGVQDVIRAGVRAFLWSNGGRMIQRYPRFLILLAGLISLSEFGACGGTAAKRDGGLVEDAGDPADGTLVPTPDDGASGGGCSAIANSAPTLSPLTSTEVAPSPTGGTLASGTYYLTSLTFYTGGAACTPPALQTSAVVVIEAASATTGTIREDTNQTTSISTIRDAVSSWTYFANGTSLAVTADCVSALSSFTRNALNPVGYTASATEIRTFGPYASCGTSVSVFARK
jgi:hypothetical protein